MTCLHQYIHAEEQAQLKFAPITARPPAPLTFRQPPSIPEETGKKKRTQVSHHRAIWLVRGGTITHNQKQEMPHAHQPWHFPHQDQGPNLHSSKKLNLLAVGQMQFCPCTLPIQSPPSKSAGNVTSPKLKGKGCHVEACHAWQSQMKCYLLLHIHPQENPGALIFMQPLHWKASILVITG